MSRESRATIVAFGCFLALPGVAMAEEQDDPTRPVTSVDLRPHYEDDTVSARNDRLNLIFRRNDKWILDGNWKLATRMDVPLAFSDSQTDANPSGAYRAGLGRVLLESYVADLLDDRWAFAAGSQLVTPASSSNLGSGNWDLVPVMGARYMLPEISNGSYFIPEVRYAVSIGRSFKSRSTSESRAASELQFGPQLKVMVGPDWFFTLFPSTDIRVNFGRKVTGQTGRLFLPLDGEIGCNLSDTQVASLEVSAPLVRDYPLYRLKIEARLSVRL
ncbi:MAG TPA: hypothetical protein VGG66_11960 [Rhizomicrobium sp.]|jgi:hypothetical protein